jgi:hypothetical protein
MHGFWGDPSRGGNFVMSQPYESPLSRVRRHIEACLIGIFLGLVCLKSALALLE